MAPLLVNYADPTRITRLVTALLNANTRDASGTPDYTTAVGDKARSSAEIADIIINAALVTARAVCESDSSPFRADFLTDFPLQQGAAIPFHYGDTSIPEIVPYDGADSIKGTRKAFDKIESYRTNKNQVYSPVAHDEPQTDADGNISGKSIISGFYDIVNGIFYFTGFSATVKVAFFTRADVFGKLSEALEPIIVRLALGMSAKEGDVSDGLFANWYAQAMNDLSEIKAGGTAFQTIDEAIKGRSQQTR